MANRNLTPFRDVLNIEVEDNSNSLLQAGAEIGEEIIRQGQEAKIAESAAELSLSLNAMQRQYQIDNQSDPFGNIEKYKKDRQALFDKYAQGISPLYRAEWRDKTFDMATRDDAAQQGWGFKQTRLNTINSVNKSMENYLNQAGSDGLAFGQSKSISVSKLWTTIVGGKGDYEAIDKQIDVLKVEIQNTDNLKECERIQERITRLDRDWETEIDLD